MKAMIFLYKYFPIINLGLIKAKHMSKTMSFFMEIYENDLINLAMRK